MICSDSQDEVAAALAELTKVETGPVRSVKVSLDNCASCILLSAAVHTYKQ